MSDENNNPLSGFIGSVVPDIAQNVIRYALDQYGNALAEQLQTIARIAGQKIQNQQR